MLQWRPDSLVGTALQLVQGSSPGAAVHFPLFVIFDGQCGSRTASGSMKECKIKKIKSN